VFRLLESGDVRSLHSGHSHLGMRDLRNQSEGYWLQLSFVSATDPDNDFDRSIACAIVLSSEGASRL
jgi:hypothetical protein